MKEKARRRKNPVSLSYFHFLLTLLFERPTLLLLISILFSSLLLLLFDTLGGCSWRHQTVSDAICCAITTHCLLTRTYLDVSEALCNNTVSHMVQSGSH